MRKGLVAVGAAAVLALGATSAVLLPRGGPHPVPAASPTPTAQPSRVPLLVPVSSGAALPTRAGLTRALMSLLRAPALGGVPGMSVVDVASGELLLSAGPGGPAAPASTAKILTAAAALEVLGPTARLTTRVVQGAVRGDVVLVGGGDPTLAGAHPVEGFPRTARLADLAAQLHGVAVRRVVVDDSLFSGPRTGPSWKPGYVTHGDVAPVSALAVDEGRTGDRPGSPRAPDPALASGQQLAALLHVRAVVRGVAPLGARVLATVQSPPVADLVERMLLRSDNDLAEALGRHVALARGLPASFVGEARAFVEVLAGVPGVAGLHDASGLSREDTVLPGTLTATLVRAAREPRLSALLSGLPVAGFDGTLADRYRKAPTATAAGVVRAKTGTLDGVSTLAGLVRTRDGRLLAFALLADGVPAGGTRGAEVALDAVAAALAGCGCS